MRVEVRCVYFRAGMVCERCGHASERHYVAGDIAHNCLDCRHEACLFVAAKLAGNAYSSDAERDAYERAMRGE
jgi:hypothetical protein